MYNLLTIIIIIADHAYSYQLRFLGCVQTLGVRNMYAPTSPCHPAFLDAGTHNLACAGRAGGFEEPFADVSVSLEWSVD